MVNVLSLPDDLLGRPAYPEGWHDFQWWITLRLGFQAPEMGWTGPGERGLIELNSNEWSVQACPDLIWEISVGILDAMETERFFAELGKRLDEVREANRMEYQRLFAELTPRLETARALERELDKKLARRFNVLDYLRDDELGLSGIIAGLLDPDGRHGQGTLFLRALLASLESLKNTPRWPDLDKSRMTVEVERRITADRRIDVSVEIVGNDGETHCLTIENKPYAGDQKNQVKDYLEYLEREYGDRFLLIYLSPTGDGPSDSSIPKTELKIWEGRFVIIPYHRGQEEQADGFEAFRIPYSLAGWLGECRKNCEVDRLRWFLRDAETFCQRTFGGQAMTTDSETNTVRDFLLSEPFNPKKLKTAKVVHDSWSAVRNEVCERFLERLCRRIKTAVMDELKDSTGDMEVVYEYDGESKYSCAVWLHRECWAQYKTAEQSKLDRRTSIGLQAHGIGPNDWRIGVCSPMPKGGMAEEERERRERLHEQLKNKLGLTKNDTWWPCWDWVDEKKGDWDSLIPDLHQECKEEGGEITKYFVDRFTEIAVKAIPIIDGIEGPDSQPNAANRGIPAAP